MKAFRRALKWLSNILFVVAILSLLIVTVVSVIASLNMRQDQLLFDSFGFGRVVTGSMEPDIPTGSLVIVQKADIASLKVGDVIMFRSDDPTVPQNAPVSHEIIRMEQDLSGETIFITKGTANLTEDTYPVYAENIIGIVSYSSVWLGKLIGLAQSTYIYPVLIGLLIVSMLQSIVDVVKQAWALHKGTTE